MSFVGVAPMEKPEYIVLVALDTPSRSTGIYISGGVMAAPTVGAVMADILPYLGVARSYAEGDPAGQTVQVPDLTGMSKKEAQALLKSLNLSAQWAYDGDIVTDQLPAAGARVAGGSDVLLYLGDVPPDTTDQKDFADAKVSD